jgi:hypothetical protein
MEASSPWQHAVRGMQVSPQGRRVLSQNGFPSTTVQHPCAQLVLVHVHTPLTHATSGLQLSQTPPLWPHAVRALPGSQIPSRQQPVVHSSHVGGGIGWHWPFASQVSLVGQAPFSGPQFTVPEQPSLTAPQSRAPQACAGVCGTQVPGRGVAHSPGSTATQNPVLPQLFCPGHSG